MTPETAVARAMLTECGPLSSWEAPTGYPSSLALCVIDSIQSVGVKYAGVEAVVQGYRQHRGAEAAATDGTPELLEVFDHLSVDGFAATIGNQNRAWSRKSAPLKAAVMKRAAETHLDHGVRTTRDLRAHSGVQGLEQAWRALPGQRSGITWRYLLMLAGDKNVKPDRMVRRFVASALGEDPKTRTNDELVAIVVGAAEELGIHPVLADHLVWRAASGRPPREPRRPDSGDPLTEAHLLGGIAEPTRVHASVVVTAVGLRTTPVGQEWAMLEALWHDRPVRLVLFANQWARTTPLTVGDRVEVVADVDIREADGVVLCVRGLEMTK